MKLFKVIDMTYDRVNSLLPARDPAPEEKPPTQKADIIDPDIVTLLVKLGFTIPQAEALCAALFNHYWYDFGIRDFVHCKRLVGFYIHDMIGRQWGWHETQPTLFPPVVYYVVAFAALLVVVMVIVNPEFEEVVHFAPVCNLYIGTWHGQLWWFALVGVSGKQRPYYRRWSGDADLYGIHSRNLWTPNGVLDRFAFWGTVVFKCWRAPYFRRFTLRQIDAAYVGMLTRMGVDLYALRRGDRDPWAPTGPMTVPHAEYCMIRSPCDI